MPNIGRRPRFRVIGYSAGLYCVADFSHPNPGITPVVKGHEDFGWVTAFKEQAEAQQLADACNERPSDAWL